MTLPDQQPHERRVAVTAHGVVQGVGFRPFVYNAARTQGLAGWVRNEVDRVRIEAQGPNDSVERFLGALREEAPPAARIDRLEVEQLPVGDDLPAGEFRIDASGGTAPPRPTIPADLATCADCLAEIRTPGERRFRYPFTNCTSCGPRWSIIRSLPYDRPRTAMAGFAMCEDCRREYEDPTDRRFHAQPIACPRCGPRLTLLDPGGRRRAESDDALERAVEAIDQGRIVALKGLGGFQLLCDATSKRAVSRLRRRKRRPDRPFAVMLGTLDQARVYCEISPREAAVLESVEAPIVLLRRRHPAGATVRGATGVPPVPPSPPPPLPEGEGRDGASPAAICPTSDFRLPTSIAPGNPDLGVMLPCTPLHHLLMDGLARPIVCTSGNLSDEPMATDTAEALERLGPIADVILTHDRPIVRPVDDSVARVDAEGLRILRRARGYAPRPLPLPSPLPPGEGRGEGVKSPLPPGEGQGEGVSGPLLAVGGHLKNAVGLALPGDEPRAVIGSHVGDLDSVSSVEVHARAIDDLLAFFDASPAAIVCDLHPDYASTREAEHLAAGLTPRFSTDRLLRVQHHHAHVAAVMAEHRLAGPVLGIAWDGAGYGTDGTVWGGEILRCERDRFQRVAHLRTFPLPGGDRATREPRRSALGLLWSSFRGDRERIAALAGEWFPPAELDLLLRAIERRVNCPQTSSMGRLFDAVAALVGLPPMISFEGQAAMALEFAVEPGESGRYELPLVEAGAAGVPPVPPSPPPPLPEGEGRDGASPAAECPTSNVQHPTSFDWEPMLGAVLADCAAGVSPGRIAARFHHALAHLAVAAADRAGLPDVALTGGCFQNAILSDLTRRRLLEAGYRVYTPRETPPGDGGVALGQLLIGAYRLHRIQTSRSAAPSS